MTDDENNGNGDGGTYNATYLVTSKDCEKAQKMVLEKIKDTEKKLDKLDTSLFGVDGTGQTGIMSIIHSNQVRILQLETQIKIWVGIGGFIGSLIGSIIVTIMLKIWGI